MGYIQMTKEEHKHNFEDMLTTAKVVVEFYCSECGKTIREEIAVPANYVINQVQPHVKAGTTSNPTDND